MLSNQLTIDQLNEGLRSLLGIASNYTNQPYYIAKMPLGNVHSICQKMLTDRIFSPCRSGFLLNSYFNIWKYLDDTGNVVVNEEKILSKYKLTER